MSCDEPCEEEQNLEQHLLGAGVSGEQLKAFKGLNPAVLLDVWNIVNDVMAVAGTPEGLKLFADLQQLISNLGFLKSAEPTLKGGISPLVAMEALSLVKEIGEYSKSSEGAILITDVQKALADFQKSAESEKGKALINKIVKFLKKLDVDLPDIK